MTFNDILNEMASLDNESVKKEVIELIKKRNFSKAVDKMNTVKVLKVVPGSIKGKISKEEYDKFRAELKLKNAGTKTTLKSAQPKRDFTKSTEFEKLISSIKPFDKLDKKLRSIRINYKGSFFKDLGELAGIHISEEENNPLRIIQSKLRKAINTANTTDLTKGDGIYKNKPIEAKKANPRNKSINFAEVFGFKTREAAANLLGGNKDDYSAPLDKEEEHPLQNEKFNKVKEKYNTQVLPFIKKEMDKILGKITKPYVLIGTNEDNAVFYKPSQYDLLVVVSDSGREQSQRASYQGFNRIIIVAKIKDGENGTPYKKVKEEPKTFFTESFEIDLVDFTKELLSVQT